MSATEAKVNLNEPNSSSQGFGERHQKRTLASFSLEGKTVVVTGGAQGICLILGEALITSGANLAIVDLNNTLAQTEAARLAALFKDRNSDDKTPPKITAHFCDVASPEIVKNTFAEIIVQHGQIDCLVAGAGFTQNIDAVDYPYDRLKALWGVNVDGVFLCATEVARHLMERKAPGSIVLIGSMSGQIVNTPQPQAPYNASKAAVRHLAASLAVEWAPFGIRVNCLSPGYTVTPLVENILVERPDLHEKWVGMTPQGRLGKPEDLCGAVVFMLSDASSYMTGANLSVDGGYTAL